MRCAKARSRESCADRRRRPLVLDESRGTRMSLAPVVMIHGAFCGGWVFERFAKRFAGAGHVVLTPDLPGHEPGAPPEAVTGLSMSDYASAIARLAGDLASPPVLVGHSLGGLVAVMAAARVRTAGVIQLAPSPP